MGAAQESRVVCIAQARMGSSRLPGKVLRRAGERTLLEHLVRRLEHAKRIDALVIATTVSPADDAVVAEADRLGCGSFRGSEQDVLARYHGAAREYGADVVVRVTADCPLIDASEVDRLVEVFQRAEGTLDYVTNQEGNKRLIPRGLDVEVFSMEALGRAFVEATEAGDREHVTPYLYRSPGRFRTRVAHWDRGDLSHLRITVDTPEDLELVCRLVDSLGPDASIDAVADEVARHPDLLEINRGVVQKGVLSEDELRRKRIAGRHLLGRADGGPSIGFGHLARIEALLDAWVELGGRATLRGVGIVGALRTRLIQAGVEIVDVNAAVLREAAKVEATRVAPGDHRDTWELARKLNAAAIAIDGYHFDRDTLARLREAAPLLAIDDLAAFCHPADVCLNQNMGFDASRYRCDSDTRLLVGHQYALFRREFRSVVPMPRQLTPPRVVMSFGGSDPASLTVPALRALLAKAPEDVHIDVVLGGGVGPKAHSAATELGRTHRSRLSILEDVQHMAEVFQGASLAVLAAGSTTWEALRCGVVPAVVAVAGNQRAVADGVARLGAGINLGWHGDLDADTIADRVVSLLADKDRLDQLSARCRGMIDGRGVYRAIDALLDAIETREKRAR